MSNETKPEIIEMKVLYVFTTVVDGIEKAAIGVEGVPLIYLSMEAIREFDVINNIQEWSNRSGLSFKLRLFAQLTTVDIIEPMKSKLTM